jgi:poly-gamma-glutamate synthesis protein (capsule biosynthesis protein)
MKKDWQDNIFYRKGIIGKVFYFLLTTLVIILIAPEARPVTLALVGDLMLGRGVNAALENDGGGGTFKDLEPWLMSADAAFGNLESPVSATLPAAPGPYNLCARPASLGILADSGFDLLSTANNHSLDCQTNEGEDLEQPKTGEWVTKAGMLAVDGPLQAVDFTVRGVRLVFLAADDISAPVPMPELTKTVKAAHETGAFVIISIHWGMEYQADATSRQRTLAKELADAGANLIVGHHPHVAQPVESLTGIGRDEPTLVFYSLGNALFDQHGLPDTRRGLLAFVRLYPDYRMGYETVPFLIEKQNHSFELMLDPANSNNYLSNPGK